MDLGAKRAQIRWLVLGQTVIYERRLREAPDIVHKPSFALRTSTVLLGESKGNARN
jgi:hypothetical protein